MAKYSLDGENKKKYEARAKEWERFEKTENKKGERLAFIQDKTAEWMLNNDALGTVEELTEYVIDGKTYKVDGKTILLDYSKHEKQIAEIIVKETGKNVCLVPRITYPQNIQTADYLIDGVKFDLKTPVGAGKNTLYGMVKSKKRQANNFVICLDKTELRMQEVEKQIEGIYRSDHTKFVDKIVLIKDNSIKRVYERKK